MSKPRSGRHARDASVSPTSLLFSRRSRRRLQRIVNPHGATRPARHRAANAHTNPRKRPLTMTLKSNRIATMDPVSEHDAALSETPRRAENSGILRIGMFSESFHPVQNGVTTSVLTLVAGLRERNHRVW